jgi:hypothetical protein
MSDINYHKEVESQAKTLLQFHKDALDKSTEYFSILMAVAGDERIDYNVRIEYLNRATLALNKGFPK